MFVASLKHLNGIGIYVSTVFSDNRAIFKKAVIFQSWDNVVHFSLWRLCFQPSPRVNRWLSSAAPTADASAPSGTVIQVRPPSTRWFGGVLFWWGHFWWFTSYNCLMKLQTKHIDCVVCRNWPRMHLLFLLRDWFWLPRSDQAFFNPHTDKYKLNK